MKGSREKDKYASNTDMSKLPNQKENKTGIINHHLPASSMMMPIKNDQLPQWLIGNDSNVTIEKPRKMTFFCTVSSTSNWWPAHSNAHYF